jgi:hypothetical protein
MRQGRPASLPVTGTRYVALAATAAAALVLAGCGSSDDDSPDAGPTPAPGTPSVSVSRPASTSSAVPSTGPSTSPGARPADQLLTATELPRLTAAAAWTQGPTGPADSEPVAACNDADLFSIGARNAVARTYTGDAAEAVEQVATFPDAATTARAGRVLASFRDTCATRVKDLHRLKVGPSQQVGVVGGKGWWYLASWVPTGTAGGHFQSVGVVVGAREIALLVMDHEGQDHDYPPNADPMIAAVKAAAAKMAGAGNP